LELFIIAGPNGVGKTTFAREFLPHYADCKNFVNADLIAQGVAPFSPEAAAFRAGRMMLNEIRSFSKKRESFAFETTLGGARGNRRTCPPRAPADVGRNGKVVKLSPSRVRSLTNKRHDS
jgi:predicted ABC-type ATPase